MRPIRCRSSVRNFFIGWMGNVEIVDVAHVENVVAARGLDIRREPHLQFDVPHHPDDYVHRIGRSAGRAGTAITIVAGANDAKAVGAIEKLIGSRSDGWPSGRLLRCGCVACGAAGNAVTTGCSIHPIFWPISFSMASTALASSAPATIVNALPERPARPVRPMRWT